jgi:hypothetical protein
MVTINILVEGGIGANDPQSNNPANVNNNNSLRQAFTKLFEKIVRQQVKTVIYLLGPVGNERNVTHTDFEFYWRDLDRPATDKNEVRQNVMRNIPSLSETQVYFFVQEVEAWILSQFDSLNVPQYTIQPGILQHSMLRQYSHAGEIPKPSTKLIRLAELFVSENRKPDAGFKYHKLKNAYQFIAALDVEQLKRDFEDVRNFSSLFGPDQIQQ